MASKRTRFLAGLKKAVVAAKRDPKTESATLVADVAESPCPSIIDEDFNNFLNALDGTSTTSTPIVERDHRLTRRKPGNRGGDKTTERQSALLRDSGPGASVGNEDTSAPIVERQQRLRRRKPHNRGGDEPAAREPALLQDSGPGSSVGNEGTTAPIVVREIQVLQEKPDNRGGDETAEREPAVLHDSGLGASIGNESTTAPVVARELQVLQEKSDNRGGDESAEREPALLHDSGPGNKGTTTAPIVVREIQVLQEKPDNRGGDETAEREPAVLHDSGLGASIGSEGTTAPIVGREIQVLQEKPDNRGGDATAEREPALLHVSGLGVSVRIEGTTAPVVARELPVLPEKPDNGGGDQPAEREPALLCDTGPGTRVGSEAFALNSNFDEAQPQRAVKRNLFPQPKDLGVHDGNILILDLNLQDDGMFLDRGIFEDLPFDLTEVTVGPVTEENVPINTNENLILDVTEPTVATVPEESGVLNANGNLALATPDNAAQPNSEVSKPKPTRKRQSYPKTWKKNLNKEKRNKGETYTNYKGVIIPAKNIGPACEVEYCRMKCAEKITEEERKLIFQQFWNIADASKKWYFLSSLVIQTPKKCNKNNETRRKNSRLYHLRVRGDLIRVCKSMFLQTLSIGEGVVDTAIDKLSKNLGGAISPDKRGKKSSQRPRPIQESLKESVRNHINCIPRMPSHYTRATSSREFLMDEIKTITDLHSLYIQWMADNHPGEKVASYRQYADIFNNEFNVSFFISKKDQCDDCTTYNNSTEEEKKALQESYAQHMNNKDIALGLLKADTLVSRQADSKLLCVLSFDYQKTMNCPKAKASIFYYRRKLSLNNFTIADVSLNDSHCYLYDETVAGKGANEVASFLYHFMTARALAGVKEFRLYSDNCGSQNKNRGIAALYLHLAEKLKVKITHRYLEKGHTYLPADKIHSSIEKRTKPHDIYSPEEWKEHILKCKKEGKKPMNVIKVEQEMIFDWMGELVPMLQLQKNNSGTDICWNKVKELSTDWNLPNQLTYKDRYDGPSLVISCKKVGRPVNLAAFTPTRIVRNAPRPLAKAKHADLMYYCDHNFIPPQYHEFYRSLPVADREEIADEGEEEAESNVPRGRPRKRKTVTKKGSNKKKKTNKKATVEVSDHESDEDVPF